MRGDPPSRRSNPFTDRDYTLRRAWLLAALIVSLGVRGLQAGAGASFRVDIWKAEQGLPQSSVIALTQTRDGYLWIGTGNGLARFDGLHFRTYGEEEIPGLNGSKIVKLFEDGRGTLWIGTETAGILMVSRDGQISRLNPGRGGDEAKLVEICEDTQGGVWLSVATGQLYRYFNGNLRLLLQDNRGLVAEDSGLVWIGTISTNLFGLGPMPAGATDAVPVSGEVTVGREPVLASSKHGGYWCLVEGRIQKRQGERLIKDLGPYPWNANKKVVAVGEDADGNLVVGTYGDGVYWFDAEGGAKKVAGLSHNFIWSLLFDREGNLWVGTDGGGLNRVKRRSFAALEPTLGATVQSVCADHQGGLWIGYNGEHVDHWRGGALQTFTNFLPPFNVARINPFYVRAVFEDRAQRVWVGALNLASLKWCLFQLNQGAFSPLLGGEVPQSSASAIFQARNGSVWIGSQSGLVCCDPPRWKVFGIGEGLSSDRIHALADDASGNLWIGTEGGGLNCLRAGKFTAFRKRDGLPSDDVSSLYVDERDVVWAGTPSGLARFEHGKWDRFTTQQGLASNKIGYIIDDGLGYLWLGSPAGLMRVARKELDDLARGDPRGLACRVFGTVDGLPTGECSAGSQPGPCRTRDGRLWFPTVEGLVALDPARLVVNTNPPPVIIESVLVDNQPQGSGALRAPPLPAVTVPANKEALEIGFTSLNLSAADKVQFRYQLEPYEAGWTTVLPAPRGAFSSAHYTKLPPGHYWFRVKACNEDGFWNERGSVLEVTVLPPFWRTPWFLTVTALSLLGMVVGSVHYVSTQRLHRQLAVMRQHEALEAERSRIARDLHDQLGANLTQIALLGEMAETDKELPGEIEAHARQICHTAGETTRALDEIVWTVNPANDTLDGLVNYVCKYAQEYLALAGLKYRLEVPPQLPNTPITPELRHNVFLAAKESINNVVKHAQATSAWLRLRLDTDRFVLEIEDNGRGLSPEAEQKGRNGLRNMRKRLQDVGGEFEIGPGAEGGTRVRLSAPIRPRGGGGG